MLHESFSNRQSQFLPLLTIVCCLAAWKRGSPASTPVHAPHAQTDSSNGVADPYGRSLRRARIYGIRLKNVRTHDQREAAQRYQNWAAQVLTFARAAETFYEGRARGDCDAALASSRRCGGAQRRGAAPARRHAAPIERGASVAVNLHFAAVRHRTTAVAPAGTAAVATGRSSRRFDHEPSAPTAAAPWPGVAIREAAMHEASERNGAPLRLSGRWPVLITGGAGFIGTNLAHRLLAAGTPVRILDNLSRPGVERNLEWLCRTHGPLVNVAVDDVRNGHAVRLAVGDAVQVFHFAAQVAVTSSIGDPVHDFDVNARGTLTVLEAIRAAGGAASLVYTSTNKVYGALGDVPLHGRPRYEPADPALRATGVGEDRPLDFHSPYGCSKGTADQYVLDYARSYRLRTAVLRMSCIYGAHQCGTEDQGWLAHFLLRAVARQPIVIYGDGHQVRDVLYVDDLVDALLLAQARMPVVAGHAFNMGGGPTRTTSLLELVARLATVVGAVPAVTFKAWRIGDQRYYVSDTRKFTRLTGWMPRVDLSEGLARLHAWLRESAAPAAALEFRRAAR